jgi:hypothetical protein
MNLLTFHRGLIPENREIFLQNAMVMRITEQALGSTAWTGSRTSRPASRHREEAMRVETWNGRPIRFVDQAAAQAGRGTGASTGQPGAQAGKPEREAV